MYQSIEETETPEEDKPKRLGFISLCLLILVAIAGVLGWQYFMSPAANISSVPINAQDVSTSIYRKAISEQNPALRRARLNDFLLSVEGSPHEAAVIAQIDVINRYELEDWDALQKEIYSLKTNQTEKLAALDIYAGKWGGAFLGGRDSEIAALRDEILAREAPSSQERRLDESDSPIPTTVDDDVLAGGYEFPRPQTVYIPPTILPERPALNTEPVTSTPLRVRRNVTPRYPKRALRRNVGALVTLSLNIDDEGRVAMTELISVDAQDYADEFISAAERAARRTRFHPRTENGVAVAVSGVQKRYRFEP